MNWTDITLGKYQHALTILNTDLPSFNKEVELVCYMLDLPKEEVLKMPIPKFKQYAKQLDFMTESLKGDMKRTFECGGKSFDVCWQVEKRTAGQFIDLTELTKDGSRINDNLHLIMAVICVPKGETYNGDSVMDRGQFFKDNLTMDIVFPIADFFLRVLNSFLIDMQDYLTKKTEQEVKELKKMLLDFMPTGDGIAHLMN